MKVNGKYFVPWCLAGYERTQTSLTYGPFSYSAQGKLGSSILDGISRFTFRTDVGTRDAHFDAVLLYFHLVAGTRSDAGAVVHHEVIWQWDRNSVSLLLLQVFHIRKAVIICCITHHSFNDFTIKILKKKIKLHLLVEQFCRRSHSNGEKLIVF